MIEVSIQEEPNIREMYRFDFRGALGARLVFYAKQSRATSRHKWVGPFWDSSDERSYHSALPRPGDIPTRVMVELRAELIKQIDKMPLYIGWWNKDHEVKR